MIYMTADQAADFFDGADIPADVVIETEEAQNARLVALLAS